MKYENFPCILFLLLASTFSMDLCNELLKIENEEVQVATTTGEVKGKIETVGKHEVFSFRGIPFAEPPTGNNRFKKPVPMKAWEGVLDATEKPPACMQMVNKDFDWIAKGDQKEDCLYLNVWVPRKFCTSIHFNVTNYKLPVMIWIHGGGFWSGSSNIDTYNGAVLAAHTNVVVASMNYRLGSFGFLYSGTSEAPGNMGLYDQLLALEWIKDNAKTFCGDPHKITLFGESSGAVSVGLHLISPKSRPLFQRAIMESGSPYSPVLSLDSNLIKMKDSQFAAALGCADEETNLITNPEKVVSCLRKFDAETLAKAESVILEKLLYSFLPVHGEDFLPKPPIEAINAKDFKQAEVLLGNNNDEGAIFLNYLMPEVFTRKNVPDLSVAQAQSMIEAFFQQNIKPTGKEVADFYLGNLTDENPEEILKAVHNSLGDFAFVCPTLFLAEQLSTKNDVFYYLFTHKSSNTIWGDWIDAGHFEEVPFVFGVPLRSKSYTSEECTFSHDVMQMWATFARHGRPLPEEDWSTYNKEEEYRELNPKNHDTGRRLRGDVCEFWKNYLN